jgi:hypothetical protein
VNSSSLTVGRTRSGQTSALSAQALQSRERVARRAGLALLAWSRRQDQRRTHEAVRLRRETQLLAARIREDAFQRVALRTR